MKIFFWMTLLSLFTQFVHADIETQDLGGQLIFEIEADRQGGPFRFEYDADLIGRSKFRDPDMPGQHITYSEAEIEGRCIYFYDECRREGLDVGLIYESSNIRWKNNPYFEQQKFHTITLSLGAFSQRWERWFLHAQVDMNVNCDHVSFFEYTTFDLTLVSRYSYWDNLGIYAGFFAQTGMLLDRIYPIIGVDWEINDCWVLNAVYPINMSLIYKYNCNLSFDLAIRPFTNRQRVGKSEELSRGLVRYSNSGAELGVNWDNSWVKTNVHAGYTFGGRVRISNKHNKHVRQHRFNSAGYCGGEVSFHF